MDSTDVEDKSVSLRERMRRRQRLLIRLSAEQNHRCCNCGRHTKLPPLIQTGKAHKDWATLERVLPGAFGGTYTYANVVMNCFVCNNKGASKISKKINEVIRRMQGGKPNRLNGDKQREMIKLALETGMVDLTEYDFGQFSAVRASLSNRVRSACPSDHACDPQAGRYDTDASPATPSPY